MREKIKQIAEGNFDLEKPIVEISTDFLELEITEGGHIEGEISIISANQVPIKGIVLSTHPFMKILSKREFIGTEYKLLYQFQGKNCEPAQKELGQFTVITNGGEKEILFTVLTREVSILTSLGQIRDLFQFADLVNQNREEALALFASADFEKIFLKREPEKRLVYHALLESSSLNQALEEFMLYLHKKEPVRLGVSKTSIAIEKEKEWYEIILMQNCSGYVGAVIEETSGFLSFEKERVMQEDFVQKRAVIHFKVAENYRNIHSWETTIKILCGSQSLIIQVHYDAGEEGEKIRAEWKESRKWKHTISYLYENWFLYQTKNLAKSRFEGNEEKLIKELQKERKKEQAEEILLPETGYQQFLVKLPQLEIPDALARKKIFCQLYEEGCISPFLYYEMLKDINEKPELLTKITGAEFAALNWGCRYHFVSMRLLDRFMQLVSHEKHFSAKIFRLAANFYDQEPLKEYLMILCSMLIKGGRTDAKYYKYFAAGIQASIKIIGLNEAFLKSMDHNQYGLIPRSVLLYFVDAKTLPDPELAYLYANILYHEREYEGILYQYGEEMYNFMKEQMKKGRISQDLFYLYRRNFERMLIDEAMVSSMAGILFKKKLICRHPMITGAILYHQETRKVEYISLKDQMAYLDIYTDQYFIVLVDRFGRRYSSSIPYDLQPLFEDGRYMKLCYEYNKSNPMLLYRLGRHILKYQQFDARAVSVAKLVLAQKDLDETFYWSSLKLVVDYYFENYEGEQLEFYLQKVELKAYSRRDRSTLLEYMITRRMYQEVMEAIDEFGYLGISPKRILKLIYYLLKDKPKVQDEFILQMCMYAFRKGKYDNSSLEYIGCNLISSLKELIAVWKAVRENSLRVKELEENILAISLFEEQRDKDIYPIFASYWEDHADTILVKAFLRYNSYESFRNGEIFPEAFYKTLKLAVTKGYLSDDFSKVALLYHLSDQQEVDEEMALWIQQTIQNLLMKGIQLSFFQKFADKMVLPSELSIKKCVSCRGEKGGHYYLRYSVETAGERKKQKPESKVMTEIMSGIFAAYLVTFYGEVIQYSIWQRVEHADRMIKSGTIHPDSYIHNKKESRFDALNLILISQEMQEDQTIYELAREYIQNTQVLDSEWTVI